MHFSEGSYWRPLFETDMTMVQVASGCSHNRCRFCDMYHKPFVASPMEEIEADIDEIARMYVKQPKRIFLTGGNAFCLPAKTLLACADAIHEKLPECESIGCFARITDIARKSDEDLKALAEAGFTMLSIGAESGSDEALAAMDKGYKAADIVEQCTRLDEAGLSYALFYLAGIAGAGRGIENARKTAEVFGQTNPEILMIHTMTPFPGTLLSQDIADGVFKPESEKEIQQELREFYALFPKKAFVLAAHFGNTVNFNANLPEDRDAILKLMDERIALDDEKRLAYARAHMRSI